MSSDTANDSGSKAPAEARSRAGVLHHVEIYVSDLTKAREFWDWFLSELGYVEFQSWPEGVSYKLGDTYLVFVQTVEKYLEAGYNRCRVGLNHLAFHAESRAAVDAMREAVLAKGCVELYAKKYPYASGPGYYALFFEGPDRMKVEMVAPSEDPAGA